MAMEDLHLPGQSMGCLGQWVDLDRLSKGVKKQKTRKEKQYNKHSHSTRPHHSQQKAVPAAGYA